MRTIVFFLLVMCGSASAGQLYKCKGPHGEVTFTNIKCPEKTEAQHYGSYANAPDAPASADTQQPVDGVQPTATPGRQPLPRIQEAPAGYKCAVNGKTWIQVTPCPATSTRTVMDPVVFGEGWVERKETVPVDQAALGHDEMCAQISARTNTSENGENASGASYERNRLRDSVGCH